MYRGAQSRGRQEILRPAVVEAEAGTRGSFFTRGTQKISLFWAHNHPIGDLTKCPYEAAFLAAGGVGGTMSNMEYANSLIPTMRSWSETVFRTALEGRDETDISQIVDRFYDAYRDDVAANPVGHAMDYIHIILDIEKAA